MDRNKLAFTTKHKETQLILANDENSFVRKFLARNPSIDLEIQRILVSDENVYVKRDLANNPSIELEIQLRLIKDDDEQVRFSIIKNGNMMILLSGPNEETVEEAVERIRGAK